MLESKKKLGSIARLKSFGRKHRDLLAVLAILVLVAVGIGIVWFLPQEQVKTIVASDEKKAELEDEFRKTLSQIVLSIFGLLLLYFTWRRTQAAESTLRITEQSHITDRYTKAIEQLGKRDGDRPNLEVRLGAIYALERIAFDSVRDHWPIMEVFTAYIRQNAPRNPNKAYDVIEKPSADIQAILTVLGRRETGPGREDSSKRNQYLNLSLSRLCGAKLTGANLKGADLSASDLRGVSFWEADLQGAALMESDLSLAKLIIADLHNAFFRDALLNEANLTQANVREAHDLTVRQVKSASHWQSASYSPSFRGELGLNSHPTADESL